MEKTGKEYSPLPLPAMEKAEHQQNHRTANKNNNLAKPFDPVGVQQHLTVT